MARKREDPAQAVRISRQALDVLRLLQVRYPEKSLAQLAEEMILRETEADRELIASLRRLREANPGLSFVELRELVLSLGLDAALKGGAPKKPT